MKVNKWTLGLAAAGLVSLPAGSQAEEKPSAIMTALSSTVISGYVSTSAEWNPGTGNAFVPGFAFNPGKQDGFNLDVVRLTIERPLDEGQWSAGYKADLWFGPDANFLASTSSGLATSDFGIRQAYVTLRAPVGNGLDFKLGTWNTIIGYESYDANENPNYTRSYGNTIEPTTHTGLLATYQVTSALNLAAGVANTFGPTINARSNPPKAESYKTYMGAISLTAPESFGFAKGATLYGCVINGFNSGAHAGTGGQQTSYYVGATVPTPLAAMKVGAAFDYHRAGSLPGVDHTYQEAVSAYTSIQATEKLSLHARGEYFWQNGSLASALLTAATASGAPPPSVGVLPSKVIAVTGTIQYDLWKNVMSRLEVRWDHAANGQPAYGGDLNNPPASGDKKNAVLVAANVIYKF